VSTQVILAERHKDKKMEIKTDRQTYLEQSKRDLDFHTLVVRSSSFGRRYLQCFRSCSANDKPLNRKKKVF